MDREKVRSLRSRLEKHLQEFDKELVLEPLNSISFTTEGMSLRISFTEKKNGRVVPRHVKDFNDLHLMFGLLKSDLLKQVTIRGTEYVIVGLHPRGKYPIIVERVKDKRQYRVEAHDVNPDFPVWRGNE